MFQRLPLISFRNSKVNTITKLCVSRRTHKYAGKEEIMELHAEDRGQGGDNVEEGGCQLLAASMVTLDLRLRPPEVCVRNIRRLC